MISWKESQEEVRKIKPDRQEFASLVMEDYYEIIKEALTALMAIDGYKTLRRDFSYPLTLFKTHLLQIPAN